MGLALKQHGLATGNGFFALFKWKITLIILYNAQLLVKFRVTFLKFGEFITMLFDI